MTFRAVLPIAWRGSGHRDELVRLVVVTYPDGRVVPCAQATGGELVPVAALRAQTRGVDGSPLPGARQVAVDPTNTSGGVACRSPSNWTSS